MSRSLTAAVLVGRSRELAALDAAFERARGGRPSTVLIGGEAGVGKSRGSASTARGLAPRVPSACCPATAWS